MIEEGEQSEREDACKETYRVEATREFRAYIIELAGGIADTGLIEEAFKEMLFVYKSHFLNGLSTQVIMSHIYNGYENDPLLPLERKDIYKLFELHFNSIGFMPEIWLNGTRVSWSNIQL